MSLRHGLAETIRETLDREWAGKVVPKVPSDLAYLIADAIIKAGIRVGPGETLNIIDESTSKGDET